MKKAFLVTDGSVDMALSLDQWLQVQSEPVDLTVVYPFALDQPLNAVTYRQARQTATGELERWLTLLPEPGSNQSGSARPGRLQSEVLLGTPELVLTIHLLLRRYDYLLIDFRQPELVSTFRGCQLQVSTQLRCLNGIEETVFSPEPAQSPAYDWSIFPISSRLAA